VVFQKTKLINEKINIRLGSELRRIITIEVIEPGSSTTEEGHAPNIFIKTGHKKQISLSPIFYLILMA